MRTRPKWAALSFFHPDYTVGTGISPVRATFEARGLYRRLGIPRLAVVLTKAGHPTPKERN